MRARSALALSMVLAAFIRLPELHVNPFQRPTERC